MVIICSSALRVRLCTHGGIEKRKREVGAGVACLRTARFKIAHGNRKRSWVEQRCRQSWQCLCALARKHIDRRRDTHRANHDAGNARHKLSRSWIRGWATELRTIANCHATRAHVGMGTHDAFLLLPPFALDDMLVAQLDAEQAQVIPTALDARNREKVHCVSPVRRTSRCRLTAPAGWLSRHAPSCSGSSRPSCRCDQSTCPFGDQFTNGPGAIAGVALAFPTPPRTRGEGGASGTAWAPAKRPGSAYVIERTIRATFTAQEAVSS